MSPRVLSLFSALLLLPAPALAHATEEREAWSSTATSLRADAAGISMPQTIAGLSLSKSGEVSHGGQGIDNYAQYLSEDGAIQATFYVYLPSYADSSLAAYMTDRAIMERFGARTRRTAYASVLLAGQTHGAIRAVYDDAADGKLTTAAGFVHAGRWLVKLRVTGPSARRKEVVAGLDGMLHGLQFDNAAAIRATAPAQFAACPANDGDDARLTGQGAAAPADIALPREGGTALCVRGQAQAAAGGYDILQQQGVRNGGVIVPVDDSGTVLAFDPAASGKGYQLSIHSIGQTELFGVYDHVPTSRQIGQILDGKDPQTARARSTADYAANGEVTVRHADAVR